MAGPIYRAKVTFMRIKQSFVFPFFPSRECLNGEEEEVIGTSERDSMTESECHREGKILFEDGNCYNLLERGPCFEQSMWVVMALQVA